MTERQTDPRYRPVSLITSNTDPCHRSEPHDGHRYLWSHDQDRFCPGVDGVVPKDAAEIIAITDAEIDALRSGLEAMRRERDEYAAAASDLMRYYDNCFDQRLQAVPANIAIIDPIKFILGQKPCYFGRRPDDRDRLAAEWDELRAAARSVRNGE